LPALICSIIGICKFLVVIITKFSDILQTCLDSLFFIGELLR